ncbi:SH3 domain-binding protein 5-like isoform 2-T3 [Callospermophilus lateralis]|uniref:SH3 domain-binding protein 5-like isoform X2 n=1 Tax=Callospermophilus lateralis TaxID=76772 RepID=UPI004054531B
MAEFRQVPGGRETPQGELRPEVVEDEIPRSPVAEEPGGGGGSNSSESKLSPREEEELDPRIQEELEHLNQASEEINQVELQLDEARTTYRRILQESARKLNTQGSHLGSCIEKARPYYEARRLAKEAQQETQKAALRYERAVSMHNAAREMVFVAEQGVMADKNRLDPTWQEMLNHATCKVNEAEEERLRGEREHQRVTRLCQQAEARVQALQKTLRRAIGKSRPYFELKAQFSQILEEHKAKVTELEQQVAQAKTRYSVALRNLEQISEQIHARRRGLPAHPPGACLVPIAVSSHQGAGTSVSPGPAQTLYFTDHEGLLLCVPPQRPTACLWYGSWEGRTSSHLQWMSPGFYSGFLSPIQWDSVGPQSVHQGVFSATSVSGSQWPCPHKKVAPPSSDRSTNCSAVCGGSISLGEMASPMSLSHAAGRGQQPP